MSAGSITRSGSGWQFVVDLPGPTGKRRQVRRRGFVSKRAAAQALAELVADAGRGAPPVAVSSLTLGGYLSGWVAGLPATGRRVTTIDSYRRVVEGRVLPHPISAVPLQRLSPIDLDAFYADLLTHGRVDGGGLSARSVRYAATIVKRALSDAERKGLVPSNVARRSDPPSLSAARSPESKVWTPDELRRFLAWADGRPYATLLRVAAMTGMRRAEVVGLRWEHVDLDSARLHVRHALTTIAAGPVAGAVKTARSRRTIDLDAATVETVRAHRRAQLETRLLMGPGWTDTGYVFTEPDGQPHHPDVVGRAFRRYVKACDLPPIRFHDLRHGHATHLLMAGVNPKIVSERLGHSTVAFTLDVYGHVMPGQQASAAAAVAAMVEG